MAQPRRVVDFTSVPRDPDRDAALVDVRTPERLRDDVVLQVDLERKLERIEEEYRAREALARLGLAPKSRLLFVGPPGCGKTVCAGVLAGDLGLPLLYVRFDGVVSSYLGETASNLRRVFSYARQHPAVLFFDEFDALGKRRDDPMEMGELKRVVSSFLQLLDAYPKECLVVAATNHEGLLDDALWRRFDEILHFPKPSLADLVRLMELRLRGVRKRGVDLETFAREMLDFSYADAERVCLEAVKVMVLSGRREVGSEMLQAELMEQRARIAIASGMRRPV